MKKSFYMLLPIVVVLTMWTLTSCSGSKTDSYVLNVNIEGLSDSAKIIIQPVTHIRDAKPLGEAYIIGGKVQFKGMAENPAGAYLCIDKGYGRLPFILEPGNITIEGTISGTPSQRDSTFTNYDFSKLVVTGSENTPRFQYIFSVRDSLFQVSSQNRKKYTALNERYYQARKSNNKDLIKKIEATDEYKAYLASEAEMSAAFNSRYTKLITNGNDSFWGPMTMLALYWYFTPDMRSLYEGFSEEAKASSYGQEVKKELYPVGRPGDKLENFRAVDTAGDSVSMEGIAAQSKYTLIDFWASWCGPCRREIANLRSIYEKHKGNGFNILSISIDKDKAAWQKALEEENLPWVNVHDTDGTIANAYGVKSIPMLVVVDSEGRLVVENARGKDLENKMDELLAK